MVPEVPLAIYTPYWFTVPLSVAWVAVVVTYWPYTVVPTPAFVVAPVPDAVT